ncbi:MAG: Calx-beta domain-containing protein [Scytonema sp. PMC 1069.18]|nr:Calx-beta domain-containing protein [Scytonema sp. PMC 1069.18]MEC4886907.1 Calx-beta domain-containing protein [Scytonema sp. PMC 1070.18]
MAVNFNGSYSQNFDTLTTSGSSNAWSNDTTIPGWSLFRQPTPGTVITAYSANNGSSNTGSFYSYGTTSSTDRALGGLGSGGSYFGSPASGDIAGWIAFSTTNTTGSTINSLNVAFNGEQWRNGGNASAQTMVLEYGFGTDFTTVPTWTAPGNNFDWTSPVATATAAAVDGNVDGRVADRGGTLNNLNWANNDTLWIRWVERNDAGSDHGLAIDDFSISAVTTPTIIINEIDSDTPGTDAAEFVELYDGGVGNTDLSGLTVVFYNGSNDQSYAAFDLDGFSTDANGYFVLGNTGIPGVSLTFSGNTLQNGADAVALYMADASDFPNGTAVTTTNLVDAIVYDTNDADDTGLLPLLNSGEPQVNEGGGTNGSDNDSLQRIPNGTGGARNTSSYQALAPTPGAANGTTPPSGLTVTIAATDAAAAEAGQDTGNFRITRTGDTTSDLTVEYTVTGTATNGTDYTPNLTGTAIIASGQSFVDITITPVDDALIESNETATLTLVDTADYDLGATTTATVTIADNDVGPGPIRIYDIQGAAHTSPLVGQSVSNVPGIVTAVDSNGFYLQDPTGDGDIATSDGIFVFTSSNPTVSVGDSILVSGTVSEFIPGGASTGNLSITQIGGSPTITTVSTGNPLPSAVILGADGRTPPTQVIDNDQATSYNVLQGGGVYEPTTDGLDFYESLEGMRVTINDALAVSPTNGFGEIFTVADNGANATGLSTRGTINIAPDDFNPERIQIQFDSGILPGFSQQVDVGAQLGDVTGVVGYNFGNFEVNVTEAFTPVAASTLQPEVSNLQGGQTQLTVASYNVLNLDPNDSDGDTDVADGRFTAIANQIVNNLNLPDIVSLQEVQDNDGSVNSNITAADQTLQLLVNQISAISGVTYSFIDNPFIGDDTNGGQPGGNIRTAFLYNPNRVSLAGDSLPNQPFQGSVQTVVDPQDQQTNPNNPFEDARLPLVGKFIFNDQEVTVINNHFSSKGGSSPLFGATQPAADLQEDPQVNGGVDARLAQAQAVKSYVDSILASNSDANVVVQGDFNEFEFISPLNTLEQSLTNLTETLLTDKERYSFIFDGNSQALDHTLISTNLANNGAEYDIVHVNTEFADTAQRASDHDPVLARLNVARNVIQGTSGRDTLVGTGNGDTIIGGSGADNLTGGAGRDEFVYTNIRDRGDTITDFETSIDKLVFTQLLNTLTGYNGSNVNDYLQITQGSSANNFNVRIDSDGSGVDIFRPFITVNTTGGNLTLSDFTVGSPA